MQSFQISDTGHWVRAQVGGYTDVCTCDDYVGGCYINMLTVCSSQHKMKKLSAVRLARQRIAAACWRSLGLRARHVCRDGQQAVLGRQVSGYELTLPI